MTPPSAAASYVDGQVAKLAVDSGRGRGALLAQTKAANTQLLVRLSFVNLPRGPRGAWFVVQTRVRNGSRYEHRVHVLADGSVQLSAARVDAKGRRRLIGRGVALRTRVVANQFLYLRVRTSGTILPRLSGRMWSAGSREPGWQMTAADADQWAVRAPGQVGLWAFVPPSTAHMDFTVDGLTVVDLTSPAATNSSGSPIPASPVATATPSVGPASPPASPSPVTTAPAATVSRTAAPKPAPAVVPASDAKPGAANTGVPDGTTLTPHYGNLIITTAGATYDSLDIHGFVSVQAPNVTIRRSIIRGGTATGNIGLVTNYGQPGFLIEDSTLTPEHPSVWLDAIKGNNFTARRIEATGTVDGAKIHGNNVRLERSWVHDTAYFTSDPSQGGGPTHNDGAQILGGDNITITGNTISIPTNQNAAIQVTQGYAPVTHTTITGNWLDGAGCTVNIANKPLPSMTGLTLTTNRFGRNRRYIDCAVLSQPAVTLTTSGNVWDDNNLPVPLRLNG